MTDEAKSKFTRRQRDFLVRALVLKERFAAGIFPDKGPQLLLLKRLEARGLLRFVGYGHDIDGEKEDEVPVWELTMKGEKVATQLNQGRSVVEAS